jgi:hypothetical protein
VLPAGTTHAGERLVWAWISVALLPLSFVLALVVGAGLVAFLGYPPASTEAVPLDVGLEVGVPTVLLGIVPGALAWLFGTRANREGDRRGLVPAIVGAALSCVFVDMNVLGSLLAR